MSTIGIGKVKLQNRGGERYRITVPKQAISAFGLEKGQELLIVIKDDGFELLPNNGGTFTFGQAYNAKLQGLLNTFRINIPSSATSKMGLNKDSVFKVELDIERKTIIYVGGK